VFIPFAGSIQVRYVRPSGPVLKLDSPLPGPAGDEISDTSASFAGAAGAVSFGADALHCVIDTSATNPIMTTASFFICLMPFIQAFVFTFEMETIIACATATISDREFRIRDPEARNGFPYNAAMDVLAHGLWGGVAFGRKSPSQWRLAFIVGMMPDVLAFGPFLLMEWGKVKWMVFPPYVYQSYNVTHSFLVWGALTGLIWFFRKRFPWVMGAWALHILCDMPTHELIFFPTPYLWPLPTPFINGWHWAQPRIMIANYAALLATYLVRRWRRVSLAT
jgi:hypothetical protein